MKARTTTSPKTVKRARRHERIRARVSGTTERPRLSVFRSNKFIYAQIIDDETGKTLVAVTDAGLKTKGKTARAEEAGKLLAKKAKEQKIGKVAFDRGGFFYAGRIKAFAEGARASGLEF